MDLVRLLWSYARTRRRRFADREALERWQEKRLGRVLRRARRDYAFYRDLPPSARLEELPILDKGDVLRCFADLNRPGVDLETAQALARRDEGSRPVEDSSEPSAGREDPDPQGRLSSWSFGLSTGTSGRPGAFLLTRSERARWSGTMLARALPRGILGGARIALFLRAANPLYRALRSRRVAFSFYDLRRRFEDLVGELAEFRPSILVAPARVLRLLAEARSRGELDIDPEKIFSVAEVLEPDDAGRISEVFARPVDQIYQASEGFLGITCREGRLHLNEDLLFFEREWIDRVSGRWTPIVTDLWRTSQAILRYRMGDVLVESGKPCPCGSVYRSVVKVEGRSDDLLCLRGSHESEVLVFADLVTRAVFAASSEVEDFRCVQVGPSRLELSLRGGGGEARRRVVAALEGLCRERGAAEIEILESAWKEDPLAVKRRRVRRVPEGSAVPPELPRR